MDTIVDPALGISLAPMLLDAGDDLPAKDDLASRFFSRGACPAEPESPDPIDEHPHGRARFASPALRQRQRYLMRCVVSAVAVSGAIGLAALLRVTTASNAMASDPWVRAAAIAPARQQVAATEPLTEVPPANPPATALALASPQPVREAALPTVAKDEQAQRAEFPAATVVTPEPSAREEKRRALHLLNEGRWAAAAVAGERSVKRDSSDAEAWLVLGASYAERGEASEARRCYATCVRLAAPGPSRSECADLLR